MFGLSVQELIFILVLALLIFGPKRLPEIGRTIGRGLSEFRRASNELKRSIEVDLEDDEPPPGRRPTLAPPLVPPASPAGAAEPVAGAAPSEPPPPIQPR
jgi:TatA/E family protein of Tat protein translocase